MQNEKCIKNVRTRCTSIHHPWAREISRVKLIVREMNPPSSITFISFAEHGGHGSDRLESKWRRDSLSGNQVLAIIARCNIA